MPPFIAHTSQKAEEKPHYRARQGSPGVGQKQIEGEGGKRGHILNGGFPGEGRGEAGEAGLGLASLNNFSGLLGVRAASCCPVPGPGAIRAGGEGAGV